MQFLLGKKVIPEIADIQEAIADMIIQGADTKDMQTDRPDQAVLLVPIQRAAVPVHLSFHRRMQGLRRVRRLNILVRRRMQGLRRVRRLNLLVRRRIQGLLLNRRQIFINRKH